MNLAGSPLDFVLAFLAGVLFSFTPCVYPLVPITAGYIIAAASRSRLKGFLLSVIYALGVAVTYSALGLIASLTGKIFGQIAATPWPYLIVAVTCIFFGLSLWDVFKMTPPVFNAKKVEGGSLFSVFLLGLISGLVVGPCTAPALATILVYVSTRQNLFYGAMLLFCFAYGMCALLILVGTFSGVISSLPRSGVWLGRIKKICGLILIMTGIYFLFQAKRYFIW